METSVLAVVTRPERTTELAELRGAFGPLDVVPLISDLLPEVIVDAVVMGFAHSDRNASGFLQNDGHVFPILRERVPTVFSEFCAHLRETSWGAEQCRHSDCAGIRLWMSGSVARGDEEFASPAPSPTQGIARYYCHANNLELLAPVRIYFGEYGKSESVMVGAFWGGQCHVKSVSEMRSTFKRIAANTGLRVEQLKKFYGLGEHLGEKEVRKVERSLLDTAEAMSRTLTDLYHRREWQRADRIIKIFTDGLARAQQEAEGEGSPDEILRGPLNEALAALRREYGLQCSAIYRVEGPVDRDHILAHRIACSPDMGTGIVRVKATRIARELTADAPADGQATVAAANEFHLVHSVLRASSRLRDPERCVVLAFTTKGTGRYLWVTAEVEGKQWQIREGGVQPALAHILEDVAPRIIAALDTMAMLSTYQRTVTELQRSTNELSVREHQRRDLVIRMAHLVTRPLLQLRLATENVRDSLGDDLGRRRVEASFLELQRAANTFRYYAKLMSEDVWADQSTPKPIDLLQLVDKVRDGLAPFARLKRRSIEIRDEDWEPAAKTIKAREEVVLEVIENVVHNAIKYSYGARPVEIAPRLVNDGVEILFTNYGCGIKADEQDRIFEVDYRSEMARQTEVEGAGIGLWVAKRLVEGEGGKVGLVSCDPFDYVDTRLGTPRKRYRVVFRLWLPFSP